MAFTATLNGLYPGLGNFQLPRGRFGLEGKERERAFLVGDAYVFRLSYFAFCYEQPGMHPSDIYAHARACAKQPDNQML